jgi:hypothetical protein
MMMQDTFSKIKDFVTNQINNDKTLLISNAPEGGYRVNRYMIYPQGNIWTLQSKDESTLVNFFSRKYAVLAAVLLNKNRKNEYNQVHYLDKQLAIASEDLSHYEILLQKCTNITTESIYIARLSRAKQSLEMVRLQIRELEKSVQLQ